MVLEHVLGGLSTRVLTTNNRTAADYKTTMLHGDLDFAAFIYSLHDLMVTLRTLELHQHRGPHEGARGLLVSAPWFFIVLHEANRPTRMLPPSPSASVQQLAL